MSDYLKIKELEKEAQKNPIGIKILVGFLLVVGSIILFLLGDSVGITQFNGWGILDQFGSSDNDLMLIAQIVGLVSLVALGGTLYMFLITKKLLTSHNSKIAISNYIGRYHRIEWTEGKGKNIISPINEAEYDVIRKEENYTNYRSNVWLMSRVEFVMESGKKIHIDRKNHNPERIDKNKIKDYHWDDPIGTEYPIVYITSDPEKGKLLKYVWFDFHALLVVSFVFFLVFVGFLIASFS